MTEPRDLAYEARVRAEMLEVVADNLRGSRRKTVTDAARLLREMAKERERLREALAFYADPESYVGISFLADPPCGEFVDDCDDEHEHALHLGVKPGRRARATLGEQEGA